MRAGQMTVYPKDTFLKTIERSLSLHQSVVEAIKTYISENDFQPGDPFLPETELAKRLGVSRNSVREAVKALESLGILETRRGIGVFIHDFSLDPILDNLPFALMKDLKELSDLLEIRQVLETGMIAKVVPTLTERNIAELNDVLARMRLRAEKGETFREADREFHKLLFQNAENETLLKLLDMFWLLFSRTSQYANLEDEYPLQTYQDHVAIVEAVVARDARAARSALEKHYAGVSGRIDSLKNTAETD